MALMEVAGVEGLSWSRSGADVNLLETLCVCQLATASDSAESLAVKLLSKLNLQKNGLTPSQWQQLEDFLLSYQDIFALNSREIGATQAVFPLIDIGVRLPVEEHVRRVPFALSW